MINALINGGFFIAGCVFGSLATAVIMLEAKKKAKQHKRKPYDPTQRKVHVIK